MSKPKNLKRAMQQVLKQQAEAARLGAVTSKILRQAEWRDGVGNFYSVRLRAMAIGLPSYCLEMFPGEDLWLEDEGITELGRFFVWLEKHAAAERIILGKRYSKIMFEAGRRCDESE